MYMKQAIVEIQLKQEYSEQTVRMGGDHHGERAWFSITNLVGFPRSSKAWIRILTCQTVNQSRWTFVLREWQKNPQDQLLGGLQYSQVRASWSKLQPRALR